MREIAKLQVTDYVVGYAGKIAVLYNAMLHCVNRDNYHEQETLCKIIISIVLINAFC